MMCFVFTFVVRPLEERNQPDDVATPVTIRQLLPKFVSLIQRAVRQSFDLG